MSHILASSRARSWQRFLAVLVFALALVLIPGQTFAALVGCRADPIIYLSNGMKIQLLVAVTTDAASVTDITYTVHVPVGVTASSVQMVQSTTTLILASKEHVVMVSDLPAKQYRASTVVTTTKPATATVTAIFTPGTTLNASGPNNTGIPISYTSP